MRSGRQKFFLHLLDSTRTVLRTATYSGRLSMLISGLFEYMPSPSFFVKTNHGTFKQKTYYYALTDGVTHYC